MHARTTLIAEVRPAVRERSAVFDIRGETLSQSPKRARSDRGARRRENGPWAGPFVSRLAVTGYLQVWHGVRMPSFSKYALIATALVE
jgi:hypothetical protein